MNCGKSLATNTTSSLSYTTSTSSSSSSASSSSSSFSPQHSPYKNTAPSSSSKSNTQNNGPYFVPKVPGVQDRFLSALINILEEDIYRLIGTETDEERYSVCIVRKQLDNGILCVSYGNRRITVYCVYLPVTGGWYCYAVYCVIMSELG
jgi:hypothetical protein